MDRNTQTMLCEKGLNLSVKVSTHAQPVQSKQADVAETFCLVQFSTGVLFGSVVKCLTCNQGVLDSFLHVNSFPNTPF